MLPLFLFSENICHNTSHLLLELAAWVSHAPDLKQPQNRYLNVSPWWPLPYWTLGQTFLKCDPCLKYAGISSGVTSLNILYSQRNTSGVESSVAMLGVRFFWFLTVWCWSCCRENLNLISTSASEQIQWLCSKNSSRFGSPILFTLLHTKFKKILHHISSTDLYNRSSLYT